ncbi:MAG: HAMP domain-containing histidine kinase, partial [Deltaproteobacteria bacterium]|nr:HAMP domain-containing histidine kinase [Deltaproteobacteria bacterium]
QGDPPISVLVRSALRFPHVFSGIGLVVLSLGAVAKLLGDLLFLKLPARSAIGLFGATLAVALLLVALAFVLARGWTYPAIAELRQETIPPGLRLPVGTKVTFALITVALATTLPSAVAYFGRIAQTQQRLQEIEAHALADVLAHGARYAGSDASHEAMATISPEVARIHIAHTPGLIAARLPASSRWIQVQPTPRPHAPITFLLVVVLGIWTLALLTGLDLGRSIGRDVRLVTQRVSALLETHPAGAEGTFSDAASPLVTKTPQLAEVQTLADAVNELLTRITKINVGSFVAVEQILEAEHLRSQFLANMSHDLKSPLNAILGFAELLERGMEGDLTPAQQDAVKEIHAKGIELFHLIVEVLDAAKVDAGRMTLLREDTLPTQFITQAARRLRDEHLPETLRIETELQAGLPPINVDPTRVAEAIAYILRFGAYELGDAGQLTLRASLTHGDPPTDRWIEVSIEDNSQGICDERLPMLFNSFHRHPGHRGLGLGLPLAKAFAELHGGSLEVSRRAEGGNRFVLRLPVQQHKALGRIRPVPV